MFFWNYKSKSSSYKRYAGDDVHSIMAYMNKTVNKFHDSDRTHSALQICITLTLHFFFSFPRSYSIFIDVCVSRLRLITMDYVNLYIPYTLYVVQYQLDVGLNE